MQAAGLEQNVWFCIPTSQLDRLGDKEDSLRKCRTNDTRTPTWQTSPWYTLLLRMSIQRPLLLPALPNLLLNPLGEKHPLVKTTSLRLAAWKITGKPSKLKEIQAVQPNLSPCPGEQILLQVTNRPGTSRLTGVVNDKLIQFVRL